MAFQGARHMNFGPVNRLTLRSPVVSALPYLPVALPLIYPYSLHFPNKFLAFELGPRASLLETQTEMLTAPDGLLSLFYHP